MEQIATNIETSIQQDPGERGIGEWAIQDEILPAARSLAGGEHIIITTGFYILSAGVIETDGPPGAIVLAHALIGIGKRVSLLIDERDEEIIRRGLENIKCSARLIVIGRDKRVSPGEVLTSDVTHMIALERPGKASDGCYYNFRGQDLSPYIVSLDSLFMEARDMGITTIGIGDGGNELGLGRVSQKVDALMEEKRPFSCKTEADFCICAGVSNWGGYGVAALLSVIESRELLPEPEGLVSLLEEIAGAGAVDGITGKNTPTVDGLSESWELEIFCTMHRIARERVVENG